MNKIKNYVSKINHYMMSQEIKGKISFLKILFDIIICNILYGATISDYFIYRFYEKRRFSRKKFMTARDKNRFYSVMNRNEARSVVQNKDAFNERFAKYIKRDCITVPGCSRQEFIDFVELHKTVFVKPVETGGGAGIVKISSQTEKLDEFYKLISSKGKHVVEAAIIQHHALAEMHPESINSIRVATFFDGKNVKILFAELRCGTGATYVDNHMSGGIVMIVDIETGKIASLASGKNSLNIVRHPDTGVFIPGFQIPHWDKCLNLIDEVARQTDGIRYVGWDIAVMEDDVCLIEANPSGDFNVWQEPTQKGCKKEMDELIEQVLSKGK